MIGKPKAKHKAKKKSVPVPEPPPSREDVPPVELPVEPRRRKKVRS